MALSSSRDNWERLVAAVVKKEQIWQLCHQDSISTIASDFTDGILSFSSNSLRPVSSSPSPQLPLTNNSVVEDRKNASKTITQKLFSALLWRRKATDYDLDQRLVGISEDYFGLESFSLHELLVATDNFSNINVLGHGGGHSTVYKGRLADGSLVAVKRLRKRVTEKELEMENLVAHHNVIQHRGFCISQKEQLLIYPFMENGSVASRLRERPEMQPPLGWQVRKAVALGVAKGLAYLHHECIKGIIHGDVKAANILLDENFEAVVADFTLAQFVDCDDGVVRGTIGHIAPEYLSSGKCSEKTDVFGYGAFLLELITGKRASDLARYADDDGMTLLYWVKNLCEKRMYEVLVDSNLQWAYVEEEVKELLQMAAVCTQNNPKERPTMLEVVRMLEDGDGLAERWEEFLINDFRNENSSSKVWDKFLINYFGLRSFSLRELLVATDNFSKRNVLGHGGHSTVYKGRLADGSLVAVKRLRKRVTEKELEMANLVAHRNVLRLRGFCISQKEQLLIYPFMENGSVASHLRERPEMQPPLGWQVRKTIALGVAKGLAYLHHECNKCIIHGDVKAANILLDENFEAVVADFTLAQFVDCDDGGIRGTIGHIAPEYISSGKCSEKTDVFGYGAFLLELITGQRASDLARYAYDDGMKLLDWVKKLCEKRMYEVLVDSNLQWAYAEEEVKELLQMAAVCKQNNPKERPTMLEVVRMLEDEDGFAERWEEFLINDFRNENSSSKVCDKFLINDFRNENSSSKVHEIGCKSSSSKVHEIGWNIDDSSSSTGAEELSGPR